MTKEYGKTPVDFDQLLKNSEAKFQRYFELLNLFDLHGTAEEKAEAQTLIAAHDPEKIFNFLIRIEQRVKEANK
ncbi:MAG TPA: hypothetical protein VD999_04425 [Vitreimonas sp.]|nr:hypothetical protein [Vitreimonas sp.]